MHDPKNQGENIATPIEAISLSTCQPEDAREIVLREADANELSLLCGNADAISLLASCIDPQCSMTARDSEGRIVAIWGITSTDKTLSPWLLCSDLIENHKGTVWRLAKHALQTLQGAANRGWLVYNYMAKENRQAREFVQALGFVVLPTPASPFDFFYLPAHV